VFTGLRPGEKLNEELVSAGEETIPTSAEKIRLVERNGGSAANVAVALQHLIESLTAGRTADLMRAVAALAPEYVASPARPPRRSSAADVRQPTLVHPPKPHAPVPVPARRGSLRARPSLLGESP